MDFLRSTKNLKKNLPNKFDTTEVSKVKLRGRFFQILCPSQKVRTLRLFYFEGFLRFTVFFIKASEADENLIIHAILAFEATFDSVSKVLCHRFLSCKPVSVDLRVSRKSAI